MRNSVRMHSAKSSAPPRCICASAILRLVGDFVRIKAALAEAKAASAPPAAGHAVGTVDRNADPAPHDDAINERHIRLGVMLDARIEGVFLAKIAERLLVSSGPPEIVERAQIPTHRECAGVIRDNDNAAHP